MANTFEGRDTQWKNSFSDLQAEVGEIIQRVKYFGQGKWLDPINRLSNWLNDNSSKIAAFIVTLPENFKIAAVAIKDIVKELFSIDFWAKNGEVIVEIFKETFIAAKDVATAIMVALMKSLAELVKVVAVNMGKSLVSGLFGNLGSFGIEALYRANVIDYDTRANLLNKLDDKVDALDNAIENWQKENKVTFEDALNNVKSSWKDVGKAISDKVKETNKTLSGLSQEIDSAFGEIVSKATRDINDNVTENISNIEPSETETSPTTSETSDTTDDKTDYTQNFLEIIKNLKRYTSGYIITKNLLTEALEQIFFSQSEKAFGSRKQTEEVFKLIENFVLKVKGDGEIEEEIARTGIIQIWKDFFKLLKQLKEMGVKVSNVFTKTIFDFIKETGALLTTFIVDLIKSSGQIGNYINAFQQGLQNGGVMGAVLSMIAQLLSDIMKVVSENSEKFQAFQNFVTLVLESLISEIVPIFDEFVTPFLEGFSAVKELLSGIVYLLGSISGIFVEIFKEFTRELNITASTVSGIFKFIGSLFQIIRGFVQFLQPIMNALSYVTKIIATAIYSIEWVIVNGINMIIKALNMLPWVNISEISGFDDYEKGVSDIWNGGGNTDEDNAYLNAAISQSASNITGASASYTAARDIYVTINYDHSYVNGDAREIAINLYNELKDCKKLNLIA